MGELQWLHNDTPIPGATGATLTLANVMPDDSGNYRLQISTGGAVELSRIQTIKVPQER